MYQRTQKKIRTIVSVISIGLLVCFLSCSRTACIRDISEGFVEYEITYIDEVVPRYDTNLRPSKMVVKFKDNNTVNKIEGLSGALSFAFIQDKEMQTTHTLVKLLNKKIYYFEPIFKDRYPFAYEDMPVFTINKTDETEEYLGLLCHKAIATFSDTLIKPFEILYTKEIAVEHPNYNTPFEEIDGVMLRFTVTLFNQKMNIKAVNIRPANISKDEFKVPIDYEEVDEETIKDVVFLLSS